MKSLLSAKGAAFGLCAVLCSSPFSQQVWADDAKLIAELADLKARIEFLEKQLSAQSATQPHSANREEKWTDRIGFSGLVEVEAASVDGVEENSSDITLAKVEIGLDAQVSEWVSASLLLLFEEDKTDPIAFDEAFIRIGNAEQSPFFLTAGLIHLPFGRFESHMVSDPITLEMGEFIETALQLGFEVGGWRSSLVLFNGDTKEQGDDKIDQFGLDIGYYWQAADADVEFDAALYYVNNIADSDGLQEAIADAENLTDQVSGVGGHLVLSVGAFTFIGEYLTATEQFDTADLAFNGVGAEPVSWNLEAAYHFALNDWDATIVLAWQGTDEALALELPEQRLMLGISLGIMQNTSLNIEWANDDDYDVADGGTGKSSDSITAELAVEF